MLAMRSASALTAVAVSKLTEPGRYAVGDGAYLQIAAGGTKAWVFRYQRDGKARHMGLGPANLVTLAEPLKRPGKPVEPFLTVLTLSSHAESEGLMRVSRPLRR